MVLREHVICGGYFWEKGGYTLGDIMKRENHKKILERVTMILYSTVIFGTCQIILNISYPVFRVRHSIFPDTLNKRVYGISFILTQEVYLYTPVFLYALYIAIFVLIPTVYKRFYFRIQLRFTQCYEPGSQKYFYSRAYSVLQSARRIGSYIVRAFYLLERKVGFETRCQFCLNVQETDTSTSTTTDENFKINL